MNNQILNKVDEIIECIKESDDYKHYLLLKDKLKNDNDVNSLLDEIRRLQKIYANNRLDKNVEILLEEKNNELRDNPLYRDYLNTIDDINNTFNIIENELNTYFFNKLN